MSNYRPVERNCDHCGATYMANRYRLAAGKGRGCSLKCGQALRSIAYGPRKPYTPKLVDAVCKTCSATFGALAPQVRMGRAKYCSRACAGIGRSASVINPKDGESYGNITVVCKREGLRGKWLVRCECGRTATRTRLEIVNNERTSCPHGSAPAHQLHLRVIEQPAGQRLLTSPGFDRGPGPRNDRCRSYGSCLDTWTRETIVGTGHSDPQGHCPAACIGYSETEPWRFLALAAHHARGAGAIEPAAYDD